MCPDEEESVLGCGCLHSDYGRPLSGVRGDAERVVVIVKSELFPLMD
jgi:hypothetical protein